VSVSERLELQLKGVKNNINSQYEEMFGIQERLDALKVHNIIVMVYCCCFKCDVCSIVIIYGDTCISVVIYGDVVELFTLVVAIMFLVSLLFVVMIAQLLLVMLMLALLLLVMVMLALLF